MGPDTRSAVLGHSAARPRLPLRKETAALVLPDAHGYVGQPIDMSNSDHPPRPVAVEDRSPTGDARQFSPSAARNCGPIREVLTRVLPRRGIVLEIGSRYWGACHLLPKALRRLVWLPSDPDAASRASIEA